MGKSHQLNILEVLPTEVLCIIVECLHNSNIKSLSCVSRRLREVCLPSLFRQVTCGFSSEGFNKLEEFLKSDLRHLVRSFLYIVPELLKPEIMDYTAYKARIFPPESYIEECESWDPVDDWHSDESESSGRYHPSYTLVYKTARNVCAKQRKITDRKRDATSISLALQRLPNLTELALEFGERTAEVGWAKSYLDLMTMDEKSFEHHIQVASAALISANDRCVPIQKVQLIDLSLLCDIGPRSQETHSLTISLAKLVKSAPSLQLLRSRSTLSLLCHTCLDIRQLHSCNTILERDSLEKFLRTNVKSLHSISIHDVEVLERHWSVPTKLTPALIRDTIGIPVKVVKRLEPFSCPCLFREGWKLLINQYDSSSVPNALKRKRDA